MPTFFPFKRGETISLALQCTAGDPLTISTITAKLRPTLGGLAVSPLAPVSAEAQVTYYPAANGAPPFWAVTIAAADSYGVPAGRYALDAELTIAGAIVITDPAYLIFQEPSTVPDEPSSTGLGFRWENSFPTSDTGVMALQWAGPLGGATMTSASAALIGLPSPNVDALAAQVATLIGEVAALQTAVAAIQAGGGSSPAPGTLDFTQAGNPLTDDL